MDLEPLFANQSRAISPPHINGTVECSRRAPAKVVTKRHAARWGHARLCRVLAFLVRIQREVVEVDPLIRSGLELEPFDLLQRQSWECCLALIDFAGAEAASALLRVELSFFVIRDDSNVFVEVVVRDDHRTTAADLESTREDQRVAPGPHRGRALFGSFTESASKAPRRFPQSTSKVFVC